MPQIRSTARANRNSPVKSDPSGNPSPLRLTEVDADFLKLLGKEGWEEFIDRQRLPCRYDPTPDVGLRLELLQHPGHLDGAGVESARRDCMTDFVYAARIGGEFD